MWTGVWRRSKGQSFWGCGWSRNRIFDEAENQHNEAKGAKGSVEWGEAKELGSSSQATQGLKVEFSISFELKKNKNKKLNRFQTGWGRDRCGGTELWPQIITQFPYRYTMEYYLAIKKKQQWNSIICSNMDGPRNYHTKWSQVRQRQISYNITYMWNLIFKNDTNVLIYDIETDSQILKQTYGYQRGNVGGRGIN